MQIPREELTEWEAFWQLEPFGSWFNEYRSALVASVIAEVNRNKKKRGKPFSPSEFMNEWGDKDEPKVTTAASMFSFIQGVQARLEVKHGARREEDLYGGTLPILYDSRGDPIPR